MKINIQPYLLVSSFINAEKSRRSFLNYNLTSSVIIGIGEISDHFH